MAMADYGALLKINNEFVNKNKNLFMDMKEAVGFELEKTTYSDNKNININNNYFVYAGCKDLLLCFYKTFFHVVSNGKLIRTYVGNDFKYETLLVKNTSIKVEHLDNDWIMEKLEVDKDMKEYLSKKKWARYVKRIGEVNRKRPLKYKTQRYIVTWEHAGNKYEVIFGYGIDPNKEVWDDIKYKSYEFTDKERVIINKWFE